MVDGNRRLCATLLDAALAVAGRRADARELLTRADSVFIYSSVVLYSYYSLVASELYAALGEDAEALRVLRRRGVGQDGPAEVILLTSTLREEARFAAATGDTAGVVWALRRLLALRSDPEPPVRAQRDSARRALAAVLHEPRPDLPSTR